MHRHQHAVLFWFAALLLFVTSSVYVDAKSGFLPFFSNRRVEADPTPAPTSEPSKRIPKKIKRRRKSSEVLPVAGSPQRKTKQVQKKKTKRVHEKKKRDSTVVRKCTEPIDATTKPKKKVRKKKVKKGSKPSKVNTRGNVQRPQIVHKGSSSKKKKVRRRRSSLKATTPKIDEPVKKLLKEIGTPSSTSQKEKRRKQKSSKSVKSTTSPKQEVMQPEKPRKKIKIKKRKTTIHGPISPSSSEVEKASKIDKEPKIEGKSEIVEPHDEKASRRKKRVRKRRPGALSGMVKEATSVMDAARSALANELGAPSIADENTEAIEDATESEIVVEKGVIENRDDEEEKPKEDALSVEIKEVEAGDEDTEEEHVAEEVADISVTLESTSLGDEEACNESTVEVSISCADSVEIEGVCEKSPGENSVAEAIEHSYSNMTRDGEHLLSDDISISCSDIVEIEGACEIPPVEDNISHDISEPTDKSGSIISNDIGKQAATEPIGENIEAEIEVSVVQVEIDESIEDSDTDIDKMGGDQPASQPVEDNMESTETNDEKGSSIEESEHDDKVEEEADSLSSQQVGESEEALVGDSDAVSATSKMIKESMKEIEPDALGNTEEHTHNDNKNDESKNVSSKGSDSDSESTDEDPEKDHVSNSMVIEKDVSVMEDEEKKTNLNAEQEQDVVNFIEEVLQEDVRSWVNDTSSDINGTRGGHQQDTSSSNKEKNEEVKPLEVKENDKGSIQDGGAVVDDNDDDEGSENDASESASVEGVNKGESANSEEDIVDSAVISDEILKLEEDEELEGSETINVVATKARLDLSTLESIEDSDSDICVSVVTWNLAESSPPEEDAAFIRKFRKSGSKSGPGSDLVLISGQECENIKPRRSEVCWGWHLLSFFCKLSSNTISFSFLMLQGSRSREYRRLMIKMLGRQYVPIALHLLGGIQFGLFAKRSFLKELEDVSVVDVTCGIGNVFHNKGAIAAFVKVKARNPAGSNKSKSLRMIFLTAHLAAHVKNTDARDSDFWRISSELEAQAPEGFLPRRSSEPSEETNQSFLFNYVDRVFFCGDLNYRVDLPRELTENTILESGKASLSMDTKEVAYTDLMRHDQLKKTIAEGRAFPGFAEGKIEFAPTFKFDKETGSYDTSHKQRIPAWTDRILFKPDGTRVLQYDSVPDAQHSDHRPVFGTYRVSMEGKDLPPRTHSRKRKHRSRTNHKRNY
jgi:hypothetical protein